MRETLSISLPNKIKKEIDQITKEDGITRSDLIRESLNDYLYFRKLNKLRNKMIFKAQSNNIFTDDDVFNKVS
jgi:metal-responsive CopG/Arc/MetJ family transcriptional regulator